MSKKLNYESTHSPLFHYPPWNSDCTGWDSGGSAEVRGCLTAEAVLWTIDGIELGIKDMPSLTHKQALAYLCVRKSSNTRSLNKGTWARNVPVWRACPARGPWVLDCASLQAYSPLAVQLVLCGEGSFAPRGLSWLGLESHAHVSLACSWVSPGWHMLENESMSCNELVAKP